METFHTAEKKFQGYGIDPARGQEKVEEVYAAQFSQGYRFRTNTKVDDVVVIRRRCEAEGLEVFVGERAFYEDGKEDSRYRTILVRGKK